MSTAAVRRRALAAARYVNHYAHIPSVIIGQGVAGRGVRCTAYFMARRQRKHKFMEGYKR